MAELIERDLELPVEPAKVWRAITDPAWLATWLADEASLELWPGGQASFVVDGEPRTGWVEEVSAPGERAPARLVFWWQADREPASRVELELSETTDGTRLRVAESRPLEILDVIGIPLRAGPTVRPDQGGPTLVHA